jgi:hypothetical protein
MDKDAPRAATGWGATCRFVWNLFMRKRQRREEEGSRDTNTYVDQHVVGAAVVREGEHGHGVDGLDQVEHQADQHEGQGRELPGGLRDEADGVEAGAAPRVAGRYVQIS